MTATAQAVPPQRRPFRLSRNKPSEPVKPVQQQQQQQQQQYVVRPTGGSKQTQPFDPDVLVRKLEIYQQELKLARARKEIADMNMRAKEAREAKVAQESEEANSPQERNDSGHDDTGSKSETSSFEEEDAIASILAPVPEERPQRPESIRRLTRPRHERKGSATRARRNPPGTYFPRFAAKQFSATTTPLPTKTTKTAKAAQLAKKVEQVNQQSAIEITDAPGPKRTFSPPPMPKPIERVAASEPLLSMGRSASVSNRRRSAFLFPEGASSSAPQTVSRQRPLSTAFEALNIGDGTYIEEANPYILSSAPQTSRHNDFAEAEQSKQNGAVRPPLKIDEHNRNDWSQASQCGESRRHSLHLHSIWRKDEPASTNSASTTLPKTRGKSQGDLSADQTMIADAVKLVQKERRKSSFMTFLKRHV